MMGLKSGFFRALGALALLMTLAGCDSMELVDPPEVFHTIPSQRYTFKTVWEVSIEALTNMEFAVDRVKEKDDNKGVATILTKMKVAKPIMSEGTEYGQRMQVRIAPEGEGFGLRVGASQWKRHVSAGERAERWVFDRPEPELQKRFEKSMQTQFSARYKDKNP